MDFTLSSHQELATRAGVSRHTAQTHPQKCNPHARRQGMKKISIYYEGWGERWPLGALADNGTQLLFEYSKEALAQQLELSPHKLPLSPQTHGSFPWYLQRLPGLVNDSLPDG